MKLRLCDSLHQHDSCSAKVSMNNIPQPDLIVGRMHCSLGEPQDRGPPSLATPRVRQPRCLPVRDWERALEMVSCRCVCHVMQKDSSSGDLCKGGEPPQTCRPDLVVGLSSLGCVPLGLPFMQRLDGDALST